jgi:transcriptional repressor NrdR
VPITVIKRGGERESFDRSKVLQGVIRACEKTGVTTLQIEALVDEIEADLQQRVVREVTSQEIGELVLRSLRSLSEVAYIRFASVYRQFRGIRDFVDTLNQLQGEILIEIPIGSDDALESRISAHPILPTLMVPAPPSSLGS